MKQRTRCIGVLGSALAYLAFVFTITRFVDDPFVQLQIFAHTSLWLVLGLLVLLWAPWRKPITAVLILALLGSSLTLPGNIARAQTPHKDSPVIVVCAAVLGVVIVGAVIVVKVKKMCDNINSNRQRFEDPPEKPPTNNVPPGKTNNVPTNAVPKKNLYVDIDNLQTCDVSTWTMPPDPDGYAYLRMVSGMLQSSTNLLSWKTEASFNVWTSPYWATVVCYDSAGLPIYTNCMPLGQEIDVGISQMVADGPQQFFRVVPWQ